MYVYIYIYYVYIFECALLKKPGRNDKLTSLYHPTPDVFLLRATLSSSTRDIGMTASLATSVVVEYRGSKLGIT